ncbi:mannose-binding protein C-like [Scomber japonicus]|uniref:mannose-binding protein C-like n=1 Tax=Scomber japonicus TaxID=13676 RepID=UPI0023053DAB|nr:mannose-binding protein C-like [Scomber japonicus]
MEKLEPLERVDLLDALESVDPLDPLESVDLLDLLCACVHMFSGLLALVCCHDLLDFVDKDLKALTKSLSKVELALNYDFVRKVGQKYFVSNQERGSFSQALEFCSQQDLELALPKNEKENSALTQLFGEVDKLVWINVNNKTAEGNFGSDMKKHALTFTKWGEGQPDISVGETGCTMLSENGVWRVSDQCSLNAYIICQI